MPPDAVPTSATVTPEALITALQRGAAQGVEPRQVLLALGFQPAESKAASDDRP